MAVLWLAALVVGIAVAAVGSRRAVTGALRIADGLGVSKGLVGVTLVAIGTDLPEIANSISASVTGHGDLNVGNATGSTLTQITLILAILLVAAPTLAVSSGRDDRLLVVPVGVLTVAATLVIALLIRDGFLSRTDGLVLVAIWVLSMILVSRWQNTTHVVEGAVRSVVGRDVVLVLAWLAIVAFSATVVVRAFVELTDTLGVPELIASTLVLALGTSLPELVVDWTAIRRGAAALAIGDLFGSSLVDASLAIGIGPMFSGTEVSSQAVRSVLIVAVGVAAATAIWQFFPRRSALLAPAYFGVYVVAMGSILLWAS